MDANSLLSIKPTGSGGKARVQSLEMIRSADDEQPIVSLQSIKLIKEERSVLVVDQAVQVF